MKKILAKALVATMVISSILTGPTSVEAKAKTKVKLSSKSITLVVGTTKTIKLKSAKASKVKWSTSNKKIATVSKGKIKAKKKGTCKVYAKYKGKKYTCKVKVKAKEVATTTTEEVTTEEQQEATTESNKKPKKKTTKTTTTEEPKKPTKTETTQQSTTEVEKTDEHTTYEDTTETTVHTHTWKVKEVFEECGVCKRTTYECECGSTKTEYGDIVQHDYQFKETVSPTCTNKGYDSYRCTKCNDEIRKNYVNALGHDIELITGEYINHCTGISGTAKCRRCGYEFDNTVKFSPARHDWVLTNTIAPHCNVDGENTYTCSHCGDTKTEVICHALADHKNVAIYIMCVPESCESARQSHYVGNETCKDAEWYYRLGYGNTINVNIDTHNNPQGSNHYAGWTYSGIWADAWKNRIEVCPYEVAEEFGDEYYQCNHYIVYCKDCQEIIYKSGTKPLVHGTSKGTKVIPAETLLKYYMEKHPCD